jgi:hypothetical protein
VKRACRPANKGRKVADKLTYSTARVDLFLYPGFGQVVIITLPPRRRAQTSSGAGGVFRTARRGAATARQPDVLAEGSGAGKTGAKAPPRWSARVLV